MYSKSKQITILCYLDEIIRNNFADRVILLWITNTEVYVVALIQGLEDYIKKNLDYLQKPVRA